MRLIGVMSVVRVDGNQVVHGAPFKPFFCSPSERWSGVAGVGPERIGDLFGI